MASADVVRHSSLGITVCLMKNRVLMPCHLMKESSGSLQWDNETRCSDGIKILNSKLWSVCLYKEQAHIDNMIHAYSEALFAAFSVFKGVIINPNHPATAVRFVQPFCFDGLLTHAPHARRRAYLYLVSATLSLSRLFRRCSLHFVSPYNSHLLRH